MRAIQVSANLIVGRDGSTIRNGSSIGLTTPADRERFHKLRQESDLIIIGGNTARREPYKRTPLPLYILTHSKVRLQPKNPQAKQFQLTPTQLLEEIKDNFKSNNSGQSIRVLIEAGPTLLTQMVSQNLVDYLYLTINHKLDGEGKISIKKLTSNFNLLNSEKINDCEFLKYVKLANGD